MKSRRVVHVLNRQPSLCAAARAAPASPASASATQHTSILYRRARMSTSILYRRARMRARTHRQTLAPNTPTPLHWSVSRVWAGASCAGCARQASPRIAVSSHCSAYPRLFDSRQTNAPPRPADPISPSPHLSLPLLFLPPSPAPAAPHDVLGWSIPLVALRAPPFQLLLEACILRRQTASPVLQAHQNPWRGAQRGTRRVNRGAQAGKRHPGGSRPEEPHQLQPPDSRRRCMACTHPNREPPSRRLGARPSEHLLAAAPPFSPLPLPSRHPRRSTFRHSTALHPLHPTGDATAPARRASASNAACASSPQPCSGGLDSPAAAGTWGYFQALCAPSTPRLAPCLPFVRPPSNQHPKLHHRPDSRFRRRHPPLGRPKTRRAAGEAAASCRATELVARRKGWIRPRALQVKARGSS